MPQIVILAGPNGAGKSTAASGLLSQDITFLNADEIAKTLPGDPSSSRDVKAGRLLLNQFDDLQDQGADIALETTLASRTLAYRIERLQRNGYRFDLFFFWLPSADLAVQRVASRVLSGGHDIPEPVIRRRYEAGLSNFFSLYRPLANIWRMYDNTRFSDPALIAKGTLRVRQTNLWEKLEGNRKNERNKTTSRKSAD